MVNCFIIYYIVDRKVPGIFVFLWLFIFIEYYFFFKYPQFIPAAMICIVTQVRPLSSPIASTEADKFLQGSHPRL